MSNIVINFLDKHNFHYLRDVELTEITFLKTGGKAELIIYPRKLSEIKGLVAFFKEKSIMYKIIGFTSNILFLDNFNYGIFISLTDIKKVHYDTKSSTITVGAGNSLTEFVEWCVGNEFLGFEGLEGIPGTIGGALVMNAGAYGYEISDFLIEVRCLLKSGKIISLKKDQLNYSFRNSFFRDNTDFIILEATFRGEKGNKFDLTYKKDLLHFKRHKYMDYTYPSLGSLFATFDLYKDIGNIYPIYYIFLRIVLKISFLKPLWFSKKVNNRKFENAFIEWYFRFSFDVQPYSDKTLNCLINRSQGTVKLLEYISVMRKLLKNSVEIENEILTPKFINLSKEKDWRPYFQ